MTRVVRLGRISAVTYSCDIATARGLCNANKGELFRHEWKKAHPVLATNNENSKYYILCKVNFKDGGLLDGFKTGIDDYTGSAPACDLVPALPNPNDVDIVGELKLVEMADGAKNFTFSGALLCVSKDGERLFIMDKRDAPKIRGVHLKKNPDENPQLAAVAGRAYWGTVHNFVKLYDPSRKAVAKQVIEGGVARFPCPTCRDFGVRYVKEHPPDYSSREGLARYLWSFHNVVNKHLDKPEFPWSNIESDLKAASVCPATSKDNPTPVKNGIVLWGSKFCIHCQRSHEAAKKAGVPVVYVETTTGNGKVLAEKKGIKAVPFMEKLVEGDVVKEHLGEMGVSDWRAFA